MRQWRPGQFDATAKITSARPGILSQSARTDAVVTTTNQHIRTSGEPPRAALPWSRPTNDRTKSGVDASQPRIADPATLSLRLYTHVFHAASQIRWAQALASVAPRCEDVGSERKRKPPKDATPPMACGIRGSADREFADPMRPSKP
jgi:hypothetical protein